MWPLWSMVRMPLLVIRGAQSDLLLEETFLRMESEGAYTHIVADAGHAPALMDAASIAVVRKFLEDEL
jgi:pimeloyl-ACP methyl ester carboxylesterase